MALETGLAQASMTNVEQRDPVATYNNLTRAEIKALAPSFNWDAYFVATGLSSIDRAVVAQPNFLKEVQRAVTASHARDLSYYETVLDPKSVYIAEDGGVISGRERVLRTFGRIFTADPPRRIEISDLSVDRRGSRRGEHEQFHVNSASCVR
jgi:predicted metalloendopeptidase